MYLGQVFTDKNCLRCKVVYTPNSSVQKYCASCKAKATKEYKKEWRLANKDKDNAVKKKWYWSNLEKAREIKRKWNWSEGGVEYRKQYAKDHKVEIYERLKKYKKRTDSRSNANYLIKKLGWKRECSECQSTTKVQIHHIDENPLNNDPKNLILLCLKHHKLRHHRKI